MIKLTKKELEVLGENKDAIAQLLVRKAILEEMEKKEYTEEEKRYLEEMKLNMEIEFYLNSIAQKTVQIYDYELLEVYKNNTEALKDKNTVEVYPQLQQALFNQKLGEEKVKVINELVEKYKINEVLKEYVKIEEPVEKTTKGDQDAIKEAQEWAKAIAEVSGVEIPTVPAN